MEGHCSAGQSPQWAVVPMEEEEEEEILTTFSEENQESLFLSAGQTYSYCRSSHYLYNMYRSADKS